MNDLFVKKNNAQILPDNKRLASIKFRKILFIYQGCTICEIQKPVTQCHLFFLSTNSVTQTHMTRLFLHQKKDFFKKKIKKKSPTVKFWADINV